MKHLIFVLVAFFSCYINVFAQCPQGNITLSTQQEVDDFASTYPGCTEVLGNLVVEGESTTSIANLNGLNAITSVAGDLNIEYNNSLTNLAGLDNLTAVDSNFVINQNYGLTSLTGLGMLNSVGGGLTIRYSEISSMASLNNLTSVGGDFKIHINDNLTSLTGLGNLTSVGGNLEFYDADALNNLTGLNNLNFLGGNLSIHNDNYLNNLTGLEGLTAIGGDLHISWSRVNSLEGLNNVTSIGGKLRTYNITGLTNMTGLESLTSIGSGLEISGGSSVSSMTGLESLTSIGESLSISAASALSSLNGLNNLGSIGTRLYLSSNSNLSNLDGLESLTSIGTNLTLSYNNDLISIEGLSGLTSVGDYIKINNNSDITNLTGLDNIDYNTITDLRLSQNSNLSICGVQSICNYLQNGGTSTISGNDPGCNSADQVLSTCTACPYNVTLSTQQEINDFPVNYPGCTDIVGNLTIRQDSTSASAIVDLSPLSQIVSIGENLTIDNNDALPNLTGLDNLVHIGKEIEIYSNASIENLSGLGNLTTIYELDIKDNPQLTSLTGLDNLDSITFNLFVFDNPLLNDLTGLENLSYVDRIYINGNDALTNLSGLENITSVPRDVIITYNPSLTSLTGLNNVSSIGMSQSFETSLYLRSNPVLNDLSALSNLDAVNTLVIGYRYSLNGPANVALTSLTGLENLTTVGNLYIKGNPYLTDISAIQNINSNQLEYIQILYNPLLSACNISSVCAYIEEHGDDYSIIGSNATNCDSADEIINTCNGSSIPCPNGDVTFHTQQQINDFAINYPNCTEISGNLIIGNSTNDTSVVDLGPLSNISSVSGFLYISGNNNLTSLEGLHNLNSVGDYFSVYENNSLTNFEGLNNLSSIGDYVKVQFNHGLIDYTGLENLTSIGKYFNTFYNNNLQSFSGLENLIEIDGNINIYGNPQLTELSGLDNIDPATIKYLKVRANPNLSICGVPSICTYLQEYGHQHDEIYGNGSTCSTISEILNSCDPLLCPDNLTLNSQQEINDFAVNAPNCTEISGNLTIDGSLNAITDLTPLSQLTSIGGNVTVTQTNVPNLAGLNNIISIGGNLTLDNNSALTDLSGLDNLTTLEGSINIHNNPQLTALTGSLDNINPATVDYINIHTNPQLSACSVPIICIYLEHHGSQDDEVYDNASGCNSTTEILNICAPTSPCPDDLTLYTQQEVNDFPANYPNCTQMNGNLTLGGNSYNDIIDLTPLSQLTSIDGDLRIRYTDLTDLSGLHNLTSIGGTLGLQINSQIINLNGLDNLTSIDFLSTYNDALNSLEGIENLTSLGGLNIEFNGGISDLSPLSNITSLEGDLRIFHTNLTSLSGLENITSMGGSLIITSSDITNFTGLDGLTSVGDHVEIKGNELLTDFSGLNQLTSIGNYLGIRNNDQLTDLTALTNLTTIEGPLQIYNNNILGDLTGLDNVDYTGITDVDIRGNHQLSICGVESICNYLQNGGTITLNNNASGCNTQVEIQNNCVVSPILCPEGDVTLATQQEVDDFATQYPDCTEINGNLRIGGTTDLPSNINDLNPLSQLTSIQGKLTIVKNDLLTNLSGLENLTTIGDDIHFGSNPSLSGLANWNNLTYIGGSIIVRNNALSDLTGFNNLTSIGRYINIGPSMTLTSLTGLESLTTINGRISVHDNPQLNNLNGLDNIDYTTITELIILNSPQLSICDVPSICSYLQNGGTADIGNNAYGCNTQTEVQNACNTTPPDNPCGGSTPSTDSLTHIFDEDLFIDGVGFANNPTVTFTDPATPTDAVLSDISLELYFRLNGNTCENEIAIQITDPAGNTQALTAFTTCDGGNGLYYVNLDVPNGSTTGSTADWIVEFDDTNDQNSGYEYSVRFARLNYIATTEGGSSETVVNEVVEISDSDLFIDGVGFENNGTYTFTDPATPADAVLSNISLELYFRLNGNSCENEIALQITDPAGNTQPLTAFTTCDGGNGLYYVNLNVPSANATGSTADWLVEFDDTNDQNSDYEYSVRFGRLTYTTTYTGVGGGMPVTVNEEVTDYADSDLFIDGVGFDNNGTYTFTDPGTPADAVLSDISLELYFRLNGNSCENEIAMQITDPAGNTQPLTAYTTCNGGNDLYYINLNVPSGNTTGNVANWLVEFDDTNDQNSDYEYSVRFGRLTYNTEYTECMPMKNEETSAQQHINTSTHQHVSTSAHKNVSTSARQHVSTLKLYPVPAHQYLNVEYFSENTNSTNIEIISNQGKMLRSKQQLLQEGLNTIQMNTADLPAGRYHIRIYNADDVQVQSFVKI